MKAIFQLATFLLLFISFSGEILGQDIIDSLNTAINNTPEIDKKLEIYSELIREYCNQDPEKALESADIALHWLPNFLIASLSLNCSTV